MNGAFKYIKRFTSSLALAVADDDRAQDYFYFKAVANELIFGSIAPLDRPTNTVTSTLDFASCHLLDNILRDPDPRKALLRSNLQHVKLSKYASQTLKQYGPNVLACLDSEVIPEFKTTINHPGKPFKLEFVGNKASEGHAASGSNLTIAT